MFIGEEISKDIALKIVSHIDSSLRKSRTDRSGKVDHHKSHYFEDIQEIQNLLEIPDDDVLGTSTNLMPGEGMGSATVETLDACDCDEEVGEDGVKKKRKKNRRKKKRMKKQ